MAALLPGQSRIFGALNENEPVHFRRVGMGRCRGLPGRLSPRLPLRARQDVVRFGREPGRWSADARNPLSMVGPRSQLGRSLHLCRGRGGRFAANPPLYFRSDFMKDEFTIGVYRAQDDSSSVRVVAQMTRRDIEFSAIGDRNLFGRPSVVVVCRTEYHLAEGKSRNRSRCGGRSTPCSNPGPPTSERSSSRCRRSISPRPPRFASGFSASPTSGRKSSSGRDCRRARASKHRAEVICPFDFESCAG